MSENTVKLEIVSGPAGPSAYINDYRIAGPKPWGGGRITQSFEVSPDGYERIKQDFAAIMRGEPVEGAAAQADGVGAVWLEESHPIPAGMSPSDAAAIARNAAPAVQPAPVTHNPHTGDPRDPRDIASDPQAVLCVAPGAPLHAAQPTLRSQIGVADYHAGVRAAQPVEEAAQPSRIVVDVDGNETRIWAAQPTLPDAGRRPTAEQVEQYLRDADAELGPECESEWVEWCRATLRAALSQPTLPDDDLTDEQIVDVLASLGIDSEPSKYEWNPVLQVRTTVPGIRKIVAAYRAALRQPQEAGQVEDVPPWRVAEFWSSSTPGTKVLMLAKDESDLTTWGKRSDFLRWVSPDHAAPTSKADAEDAAKALAALASYPLEEFNMLKAADEKLIYGANDWKLTVGDVRRARVALAAKQAGEVK